VLDGFWLLEVRLVTYLFSVLAAAFAISMFFYIARNKALILVACADSSWLACNILWAVGDLSHVPRALLAAKVMFFVGLLLCAAAYQASEPGQRLSALVLSRLRVMKYFGG
jgi:hypothetical protein